MSENNEKKDSKLEINNLIKCVGTLFNSTIDALKTEKETKEQELEIDSDISDDDEEIHENNNTECEYKKKIKYIKQLLKLLSKII